MSTNRQAQIFEPVYKDKLPQLLKTINKYDQWLQFEADNQSRIRNFVNFRYKKFTKSSVVLQNVLSNNLPKPFKLRSCVDSSYRNVFTKPYRLSKSPQESFISTCSVNRIFENYRESLAKSFSDIDNIETERFEETETKDSFLKSGTAFECERIKIRGSYYGKIEVDNKYLAFFSDGSIKPCSEEYIGSALAFTSERRVCNYL